ncbi:MAG TPA: DUF559 domain-containing protein [Actinomycetota bacterium]|nr:DUF559 domain-containing protein [Actinomycetota bacterium]
MLTNLVSPDRLHAVVARNRGRRGCRALGSVLGAGVREGRWTSALERRVESVLAGADLPAFVREYPFAPYRLDFAWPEQLVAIEADGRRWHSSSDDFVRDRAKHNRLVTAGWRILRVTWMDVERPDRLVEAVRTLLRDSA